MTTVLTFHRVVHHVEKDHDLSWDSFRRLVDFVSGPTTDLQRPSSSQSTALTFDDGTEDHLRVAEELARSGLSAIFFIPAGHIGDPGRMDDRQVHELVSMGHVVGSHALNHRPLAGISSQQLAQEVHESRVRLEGICGQPVVFFAPPGGIRHQALTDVLTSEAYLACRSVRWGIYRADAERWDIPCVPVTEYTWKKGWVRFAIDRHSLPLVMRLGRTVKNLLPPGPAGRIRGRLHAPDKRLEDD